MAEQVALISDEIKNAGMKGSGGEEVILQFLRKYLPKKYAVGQGKIVDFSGKESRQIDILIYDALNTVPFFEDGKNVIIPIENVFAVIEVKTSINKTNFIDTLEAFNFVFDLQTPVEYITLRSRELAIKDLSLVNYFKRHPKCFIIGLDASKSTSVKTLMPIYLSFVRKHKIKFPLVSFCGILNDVFFIDILDEKKAEEAENPCEVYVNNSSNDTLLFFLLNLISSTGDSVIKEPDYSLYLAYYKKLSIKERLSDGWLFH